VREASRKRHKVPGRDGAGGPGAGERRRGRLPTPTRGGPGRIPAAAGDEGVRVGPDALPAAADPVSTQPTPSPLILIADDSRTIVAMVGSRLERSGYAIVSAADGEEALRLAEERLPALVILDVEMPKLDGHEVARRLRAGEATRAIPIVMLTGRDDAEALAAGYDAGADDYVTKPFSPQELESRVERILGRR
jgi:CheY-like chemotaxis protein